MCSKLFQNNKINEINYLFEVQPDRKRRKVAYGVKTNKNFKIKQVE